MVSEDRNVLTRRNYITVLSTWQMPPLDVLPISMTYPFAIIDVKALTSQPNWASVDDNSSTFPRMISAVSRLEVWADPE